MNLDSKIPSGPLDKQWERHQFELRLVNPANKRKYKVIVVGSGLAGASAAGRDFRVQIHYFNASLP